MTRLYLLAGAALALLLALPGQAAAQCNDCIDDLCGFQFHHDDCPAVDDHIPWEGPCEQGCNPGTCEVHDDDICWAEDDDLDQLVLGGDWPGVASAVLDGRAQIDATGDILYVLSCHGERVIGRLPLPQGSGHVIAMNVMAEREAVIAKLLQQP